MQQDLYLFLLLNKKLPMKEKWLYWATQLQSIAQAGLTFSNDRYDLERYQKIRDLSVEILNEYTGIGYEKVKDLFASETGYQTPKVDIRAVVIKDSRILLVKERTDGKWSLPGGWADVNSSVGESAVRECREEAGTEVTPKRILAVQLANKHNNKLFPYTIYKIFVECEHIRTEFADNTETDEACFFSSDSLPELSEIRNTRSQIEMCFNAVTLNPFEALFD